MDFEIGQRTQARMQLRHLYNQYSCLPSGTPEYWDGLLKDFDLHLFLRLSTRTGRFLIFYDIHGELSVIESFGRHESFGKAFERVRRKSVLHKRELIQMRKDLNAAEEKRQNYDIDQCGEEIGVELHHATKRRVINDNVDAFAPEKPKLGGVIL